jgi:hypothetical protein
MKTLPQPLWIITRNQAVFIEFRGPKALLNLPGGRLHGRMPEPVEEGTSVVGTGDVIVESGEDSERSPRRRTLRLLYPNTLYFDIGGMVCDGTDDLEWDIAPAPKG